MSKHVNCNNCGVHLKDTPWSSFYVLGNITFCPNCYPTPTALLFVSRHEPNNEQVALAKAMGFSSIIQKPITFSENPRQDLLDAGIYEKTIAVVAPSHITNMLLNEGYTLIEFVNAPLKREKGVFGCMGAYVYSLPEYTKQIDKSWDQAYQQAGAGGLFPEKEYPYRLYGAIKQSYIALYTTNKSPCFIHYKQEPLC